MGDIFIENGILELWKVYYTCERISRREELLQLRM